MGAVETVRRVIDVFQEARVTFLAASVAFYAFLSIIPLLLLALAVGSLLGGEAFAERIISLVEEQLSGQGAAVIEQALSSSAGRGGASAASLLVLAWSALKVFRGLDIAFDDIYRSDAEPSLVQQVIDGLAVLVPVSLAIVLMVGLGAVLSRPGLVTIPYLDVLGWIALVIGLAVVFLPLYYVLPPVDVSIREVLPGVLLVSVGWLVLQAAFQVYASNAGRYQAYGFLGAILLFEMWLYFASILVLLGAVVNVVLADRAPHDR